MNVDELRKECSRLFGSETIADSKEVIDIYCEFIFKTVQNHHHDAVYTQAEADAKIILQMVFTKALSLKQLVSGVNYTANNGDKMNSIVDPTVIAPLIRGLYEIVGLFNLIFCTTKSKDERDILYLLWTSSGLKYRQRFVSVIQKPEGENWDKMQDEKNAIDAIKAEIEATALYKSLDEKNQNKIQSRLKDKEYLIMFDEKEIKFLHWHELVTTMGMLPQMLDNVYTYFSLYSHPSQVSVFQFADMFKKGAEASPAMVNFNLKIAFYLISIFIADYIRLFPNVLKTFESMNIRDQIVINWFNTFSRNYDYSINDTWKIIN